MFDENVASIQEEELLERRNLLKNIHPLMKLWYNSASTVVVKEKYGPFPSFWQDLESWEHLKILKKLYLKVTERSESGLEVDVCALEKLLADELDSVTTNASDNAVIEEATDNGDADKTVKKRRNRWGAAPAVVPNSTTTTTEETGVAVATSSVDAELDLDAKKSRRSRWSTADVTLIPTLPMIIPLSQEVVQQTMVLKVQLEQIGQRLVTVAQDAARISLDPSRSPSPPPRYDGSGKRSNTRDVRMKEELIEQRGKIIEELMKINPQFQPPSDFVRTKPFKRLMIPFREFPTYNFIGLIIGPRGNTQKELEQATGCKISIRGKGSSKEGSKGRAGKNPDDDEELHVHVTADDAAKVEEAAKLIAAFLNPIDDDKNDHKQKQLKELALINGTFKEEEYCPVCGEKGHRQFECPHRAKTFKAAGVKCSICGDLSHPTRDCPQKKDEPTNAVVLDSEYDSFMAELGDGGGGGGGGVSARAPSNSNSSSSSTLNAVPRSDKPLRASEGTEVGGVTMLGTVDLSGIFSSTPASSSSYKPTYLKPVDLAVPAAAPKRQQTIIVVTTVLTGYVGTGSIYPTLATSAPPLVSYATTPNIVPASMPGMPMLPPPGGIAAPWSLPAQSQLQPQQMPHHQPHQTYSYTGYDNNINPSAFYPPPASSNYYHQPPNPYGGGNISMPSLPHVGVPPLPPTENLPPPPSSTSTSTASIAASPWLTNAEQQQQGQQGIPYNYMTGR